MARERNVRKRITSVFVVAEGYRMNTGEVTTDSAEIYGTEKEVTDVMIKDFFRDNNEFIVGQVLSKAIKSATYVMPEEQFLTLATIEKEDNEDDNN